MDSTIQNILLDLKILSMVDPNGRLHLQHGVLAVEPHAFWLPIKRYFASANRHSVYQRIKQRITELETLFQQNMIQEEWVKDEFKKLVEPVRSGIQNLKETYAVDSQMCAHLDLILSRFIHVSKTFLSN
jgi:hypothetical protein